MEVLQTKVRQLVVNVFLNIHTILLIIGMIFISISAFLINLIIGCGVTGMLLIILAWLISKEAG